jgi:alkylation response protein AidB-like acyl-CoA dehydrogenase
MAGLVYAMDATTYLTAGLLDRDESDFMLETAMLKVFTSESLWTVVYETMQVFGGRSFFTDAPYERMMRDARLNMIGEGANEVLRAFIGAVGMRDVGKTLQGVAEAFRHPRSGFPTLLAFGRRSLSSVLKGPAVPLRSPQLAAQARQLGRAIRRFGMSVTRLLARHREQIVEQQLALDRIATSAIALYTATAVLSKLDWDLANSNGRAGALDADVAVGKLYCREAFETLHRSLDGLFRNHDAAVATVSDRLTRL